MKNALYQFRCIANPRVIFKPAEMHDVEGMRQHPEYEEVDAEGEPVAKKAGEVVQRIPVTLAKEPVAKAAKRGRR